RSGGFVVKRCGGVLAVALFLGLSALAQAPQEGGWVALFDGKDLSGWKKNGDEKWIVEQGTILCGSPANKYGYLTTEKTYRELTLHLKLNGTKIVDFTDLAPKFTDGVIGLQIHTGGGVKVRWKDISIREN